MSTYSAASSTPPAAFGAVRYPGSIGLRPPLPVLGATVAPVGQRTGLRPPLPVVGATVAPVGLRTGTLPLTFPTPPAYTTYYYRTTGGSRSSTTSIGSIPAGAVVLYQVVTQP